MKFDFWGTYHAMLFLILPPKESFLQLDHFGIASSECASRVIWLSCQHSYYRTLLKQPLWARLSTLIPLFTVLEENFQNGCALCTIHHRWAALNILWRSMRRTYFSLVFLTSRGWGWAASSSRILRTRGAAKG